VVVLLAAVAGGWALIAAGQNEVYVRNPSGFGDPSVEVGERDVAVISVQRAQALSASKQQPLLDSLTALQFELVKLKGALAASKQGALGNGTLTVEGAVSDGDENDNRSRSRSIDTSDFVTRSQLTAQSDEIHDALSDLTGSLSANKLTVDDTFSLGLDPKVTSAATFAIQGSGTSTGKLAQFLDSTGAARTTIADNGFIGIGTDAAKRTALNIGMSFADDPSSPMVGTYTDISMLDETNGINAYHYGDYIDMHTPENSSGYLRGIYGEQIKVTRGGTGNGYVYGGSLVDFYLAGQSTVTYISAATNRLWLTESSHGINTGGIGGAVYVQNDAFANNTNGANGNVRVQNNGRATNASGITGSVTTQHSGQITTAYGGSFTFDHTSTSTTTTGYGANIEVKGTGPITTAYGTRINFSGTNPITNAYGLYLDDISALGTTNSFSIYSEGGTNYLADDLGIGTSTPSAQLTTTGSVRFANFGAGSLQTDANGNLSVSSDERLKTDIASFDRSLAAVLEIDPINYRWREETGFDTEHVYSGFSAQDIQEVIPEAVGVDKDGMLTLTDRPILAAVVNAVKALNANIVGLSETIAGYAQSFSSEQLNTRQLCLDDICIGRDELVEMLDEAQVEPRDPASSATRNAGASAAPTTGAATSSAAGTTTAATTSATTTTSTTTTASSTTATTTATTTPDTTAPVITIAGSDVILTEGDTYTDDGATALDDTDGDLTDALTVDNPVDTTTPANYTVTYSVTDAAGNTVTAERTVTVEAVTAGSVDGTGATNADAASTTSQAA